MRKEKVIWEFLVRGEKVEVEAGKEEGDALFQLSKALGIGSPWSKKYSIEEIKKLKPKLLAKSLLR